jgi:hypothetical protein
MGRIEEPAEQSRAALPIEKRFIHDFFCLEVDKMTGEQAKKEIKELHLAYLVQYDTLHTIILDALKRDHEHMLQDHQNALEDRH